MTKVSCSKLPVSLLCLFLSLSVVFGSPETPDFLEENALACAPTVEMECADDVVFTISDPNMCSTTVFFDPPVVVDPCDDVSCMYTVELRDIIGDGWSGASLSVLIDEEVISPMGGWTIVSGTDAVFNFTAMAGDDIEVFYSDCAFDSENIWTITDCYGVVISTGVGSDYDDSMCGNDPMLADEATGTNGPIVATQISGPMSDSSIGAGDGDLLEPGIYEAVYEYTDCDGITTTCSVEIDVRSSFDFALACSNLNVSVDQDCQILITPFMVLSGMEDYCESHFQVSIEDYHGDPFGTVIGNSVLLDRASIGKDLTVTVEIISGTNSCWGTITVEDKFPPQITCPTEPIITTCNGLANIELDISVDNCGNPAELLLIDEEVDPFEDCDPDFLSTIVRTYVAQDEFGHQSLPCVVTILVKRIDINEVVYPHDLTTLTGSGIPCTGGNYVFEDGIPLPWPMTGSGTGVPYVDGSPLKPDVVYSNCNLYVNYTDELIKDGCVKKIKRSWNVREWACDGEKFGSSIQLIEIVDNTGPVIEPITQILEGTTTYECEGYIYMPPITAEDDCSELASVDMIYPGGITQDANGGPITLPVGENIVRYIAYDGCYNSSFIDVQVNISDKTVPTTVCEVNTVVSVPHGGNVEVWAETFDDGSHDECGLKDIVVRRMDAVCDTSDVRFDDVVNFCCEDVGEEVMVVLRAIDHYGNWNECMVVVHVQDKITPDITCPPDVTISCLDTYDLNNPNIFFGEPIISDNCSNPSNVENVFLTGPNSCNTGVLEREIRIKDEITGEVIKSCIQRITILPTTPFDENSIIWPEDYYSDGCSTAKMEPSDLEDPFGFPTVFENQCDLIGYNWEDDVFEAVPGQDFCFKIIRHWTLINWCEVIDDDYTTYTYDQLLVVSNTINPDVNCAPLTFESNDIDCADVPIDATVMGMDDCTMELDYRWSIDLNNNGINEHSGTGSNIQGSYPPGNHTIYWTVLDMCGNEDVCTQPIHLINTKAPVAVCLNGLSVDLNPMDTDNDGTVDNEMVILWASDFDKDSYHPCGNEVVVSFSKDTTDIFLELDCDDIGIYTVELYVTDVITGVSAFCITFVDVQDNNQVNVCNGLGGGQRVAVEGRVMTENAMMVEDVEIFLNGYNSPSNMTNEDGLYSFPNMPTGDSYNIVPQKNTNHINGVSTLDVVMIQRHILGIEGLDSPYKRLAADVNDSESISGIDLVQIRKLILGVYDEFPNVESWRFIDVNHNFIDTDEPWTSILPPNYIIDSLQMDMMIDFVGIKMGDVNDSADTHMFSSGSVEARNTGAQLQYELVNLQETTEISFRLNQEGSWSGAQFVMDLGGLDFVSLKAGAWKISPEHYSINDDKLYVSYNDAYANAVDANTELFKVIGKGSSSGVSFRKDLVSVEIYDENLEVQQLGLENLNPASLQISRPTPNPWTNEFSFNISVDDRQKSKVQIYDINGQLLVTRNVDLEAGANKISFNHDEVQKYGALMVRIIADNFEQTMRVIHVN